MYTPENIAEMTDEDAQKALGSLAAMIYSTDRWKTQLGRDIGYTKEAVNNWHRAGNRPPALVIIWLETTLRLQAAETTLGNMAAALSALSAYKKPQP